MLTSYPEFIIFSRMNPSSVEAIRHHLDHFEAFLGTIGMNPALVTTDHIAQWCEAQRAVNSNPNTVIQRRNSVSRYFRYLVRVGIIQANPVDLAMLPKIKKVKPVRYAFSEDQYRTILEATAKHKSPWWHNACVVAWTTGLRLSDVSLLAKSALNLKEHTFTLVPYKTRAIKPDPVEIPIDNDCWPAVVHQFNDRTWGDSPYLFPAMQSQCCTGPKCTRALTNAFITICKRAGLPNHSFHSFRHSFITRMLEGGMDTLMICAITGLDPKQVQTYAHIGVDAKRKAIHSAKLVLAQKGSFEPETGLVIVPAA